MCNEIKTCWSPDFQTRLKSWLCCAGGQPAPLHSFYISGTGEHIDTWKHGKKLQIKKFKLNVHVSTRESRWERRRTVCLGVRQKEIFESLHVEGGKRAISKPTPLLRRCVPSRARIQDGCWEVELCPLPFSSSCCVDFSQWFELSLFEAREQELYKSLALLLSIADRLALQPLGPHGIPLTLWCSLSWRKGKQRIPHRDRHSPSYIKEESYPVGRAQNHGLGRSWQKSGITFWTLKTKASQPHIPQDNASRLPRTPCDLPRPT